MRRPGAYNLVARVAAQPLRPSALPVRLLLAREALPHREGGPRSAGAGGGGGAGAGGTCGIGLARRLAQHLLVQTAQLPLQL
jgi:hypothetical protein